jgi:hypothetical protein
MTKNNYPIDYLHHFLSKEMIGQIATATNDYSVEERGKSIYVSCQEMTQ